MMGTDKLGTVHPSFMATEDLDILHEMGGRTWSLQWILNVFWQSNEYIAGDFF